MEDRCLLASFVVDTVVDESDGNVSAGDLSLREAIETANAQAGADTITFSPTVFGTAQTIDLVLGEFAITDDLTITGPGQDLSTIDAQQSSRHLNIDDGDENNEVQVEISDLTLINGRADDGVAAFTVDDEGGAILSWERLVLQDITLSANRAESLGGALAVYGLTEISHAMIVDNSARGDGGGIFNQGETNILRSIISGNRGTGEGTVSGRGGGVSNFGNLAIEQSTISENQASTGGGVSNSRTARIMTTTIVENLGSNGAGVRTGQATTLLIENSTFSGNRGAEGGGILIDGSDSTVRIDNATITENIATGKTLGVGGGISSRESLSLITNSIIAGNIDRDGNPNDVEGPGARGSFNLIGDPDSAGWYTHGTNDNIVGQDDGSGGRELLDISTVLGPLADNGGPTQTHALLRNSPAIDAGNPDFDPADFDPPLTTDQRGGSFSRRVNGQQTLTARIDIGAFELQPAAATVELSTNGRDFSVDENSSQTLNIRLSQPPITNVVVRFSNSHAQNLELSQADVTFTPANWNQFQTLTFSGIPNVQRTDDIVATIAVDVVDSLSDDAFDAAGGTFDVTVIDVPLTPALTGPIGTIQDARPTITWDEIPGAVSYEVWLTRIGDDSGPVINPTVTGTEFVLTEDLTIARYRTWVRANLEGGGRSPWATTTFSFSSAVNIRPLTDQDDALRPLISWDALPGADGYRVFVRNETSGDVATDTTVTESSFTPTSDLPFGRYSVWVRGIGPDNFQGTWSTVVRHSISPQPLSPAGPSFETQPTFSWSSLAGVESYQLYVQSGREVIINQSGISATTFTHDVPFSNGLHRWWIRPFHANGNAGNWSARGEFHVGGRTGIIQPANTVTDALTTIRWAAVEGADSYEVYLYDDDRGALVQRVAGINGTTFTAQPIADGNYRVWVRPLRTNATGGFWSRPASFVVDAATSTATATPVSPVTPTFDSTPTFEWTGQNGAATYDLYLTNGETVIHQTGLTSPTWTPPTALTAGPWHWWVRALTSTGAAGPWSFKLEFEITE